MLTARQVADYFLTLVNEEVGDSLSNLKLQKLVYYAQGFQLALTGSPLFLDEIQAWEHGPVVPSLYRTFKQSGSGAVPRPDGIDLDDYSEDERGLLDEVFTVYGQFSAWKLRNLTHDEKPWKDAYSIAPSTPISYESMREYFRTLVNVKEAQE